MAPINLPDGSQVSEIVLPDGSTASEVLAPDGSRVFSGIPDSLELQHTATSVSGGELTWKDDRDTSDMSLTGNEADGTFANGDETLEFADSDFGAITLPSSLTGTGFQSATYELAFQTTDSSETQYLAAFSHSGMRFDIVLNEDSSFSKDSGAIYMILEDQDNNRLSRFIETINGNDADLDDGNRHDVTFSINDSTQNDVDVIIDGSTVTADADTNQSPDNFSSSLDGDLGITARADGSGSFTANLDAGIGAIRIWTSGVNEQTISSYPF